MLIRKGDIGRTYRCGNEKRKMKAAKETERKRVSGALKKLSFRRLVPPRSRNQIGNHSIY